MKHFINHIKSSFRAGDFLTRLIYINAGAFALVQLALLVCRFFNLPDYWVQYLEMPAWLPSLARQPWSVLTYMILHTHFVHAIFNLIALYYFGRLFLSYYTQKQLVATYIWGGLAGALFYLLGVNFLPAYDAIKHLDYLVGASASVMAILFAAVGCAPDNEINLTLIGRVKLKYIGLAFLAFDILSLGGINSGGSLAHIGGAIMGYLYAYLYTRGTDLSRPINAVINTLVNAWPKQSPLKKGRIKVTTNNTRHMSDAEWNQQHKQSEKARQERIDLLLDKIKKSGYQNLTEEEKKSLFDLSKPKS